MVASALLRLVRSSLLFAACAGAFGLASGCTADNPLYMPGGTDPGSLDGGGAGADGGGGAVVRGDGSVDLSALTGAPDLSVPTNPGCGGPGQDCCPGDVCTGGGCCNQGTCIQSGQDCSRNNRVCAQGKCTSCGGHGEPCCEDGTCTGNGCCIADHTCVSDGKSCGNGCAAGACGTCNGGSCDTRGASCGGDGDPCCQTPNPYPNFCSGGGLVCAARNGAAETCQSCGDARSPCCDGNRCTGGGCCVAGRCVADGDSCGQTQCSSGSCGNGKCGGFGQPCCVPQGGGPGLCTAPDTRCINNACAACGGAGERCCLDYASGLPIACGAPYKPTGLTTVNGQLTGTCICN